MVSDKDYLALNPEQRQEQIDAWITMYGDILDLQQAAEELDVEAAEYDAKTKEIRDRRAAKQRRIADLQAEIRDLENEHFRPANIARNARERADAKRALAAKMHEEYTAARRESRMPNPIKENN